MLSSCINGNWSATDGNHFLSASGVCYAARGVYMILYAMDVRADSEVSQDEVSIPHFVSCLNIVIVLE